MKKNDLLDNPLADKGIKAVKLGVSGYEKAQKWLWYLVVAKWVAIAVVVGGLLIGGAYFVSGMKDMVTDAVVTEVKEVASEKTAEVKALAASKVAAAKEKAKGHSVKDLSGAFTRFVKKVEATKEELVDGALIENGYHPDAPAHCIGNNDTTGHCMNYTDREVDGGDYTTIKLWEYACPKSYEQAMQLLQANNKVTKNEYRMLHDVCAVELEVDNEKEKELMKQRMIERAGT